MSGVKLNRKWFFPFCNTAFKGTLALFAHFNIQHRERLNVDGPVIYVCNHLSILDPSIIASILPRGAYFLAKRELFSNPLFTSLLKGWGAYPVSRYSADLRALRWVRTVLGNDEAVVLFPEGTRSRNLEGLKRGQIGTAVAAVQSQATIVPIALHGTDNMHNILKVFMPIAQIEISVGVPFKVHPDVSSRSELQTATNEIMARIASELPANRRGVYADAAGDGYELTISESGYTS